MASSDNDEQSNFQMENRIFCFRLRSYENLQISEGMAKAWMDWSISEQT